MSERTKQLIGAVVCIFAWCVVIVRVEVDGGAWWSMLAFLFAARAGAFWDRAIPDWRPEERKP